MSCPNFRCPTFVIATLLLPLCCPPQIVVAQGFFVTSGWLRTATDGSGLQRGDAITLTWGILQDGTAITRSGSIAAETNDPSSLIDFLDSNIGAGDGGSDLTTRPWFSLFEDSYNRWGEVSGLSFNYESNDNGDDIRDFPAGVLGTVADMRIGGHSIDGQSGGNVLAYNYYPQAGDMVIDTDNISFYSNDQNNYRRLRNVIMHEVGHGLGIRHLVSDDARFLMEPFIDLNFDGPQFADVLAANRLYGDKYEKNGGNDNVNDATELVLEKKNGVLSVAIGLDADDTVVAAGDTEFVSIDGADDEDFFSFEIKADNNQVTIELDPMGPTYLARAQGAPVEDNVSFDASAQNDLNFTLFDVDGTTVLDFIDQTGLGEGELLTRFLDKGTYYIRVAGDPDIDQAQFYSLNITAVPEPEFILFLTVVSAFGFVFVRSRSGRHANSRG